mgnify:CR=1 FL=1
MSIDTRLNPQMTEDERIAVTAAFAIWHILLKKKNDTKYILDKKKRIFC